MFKRFCTVLILPLFFIISCTSTPRANTQRQLKLSVPEDPQTMDPRKGGDAVSSHLHFMLFEGLTRLHEDGTTAPAQCYDIEISQDQRTYTFHLGRTKWSNGTTVTSYDFEQSWKEILSPSFPAPNAHLFYPIKNAEAAKNGKAPLSSVGIHAPDPGTLVVELQAPTPYFLQLISFCVFFPINTTLDASHPEWPCKVGKSFVCNGPFVLDSWRHHNEIIVKKNPHYRKADEIGLDSIHLSVIANEMTAYQMYENGELDFVGHPFSSIPTEVLVNQHNHGKLKISPAAATTFITFNTQCGPFQNANLRKAFAFAINREEIVMNMTELDEQVATDAIPSILKKGRSDHFFKDNNVPLAHQHLQIALKELGIQKKDLNNLTYCYSNSDSHHKIAQVLQNQWHETLGIRIKLQSMENKMLLDRLTKRHYDFAQTLWRAQYHDPMNILERFKLKHNPKNYAAWENYQFKELLEQSSLLHGEERMEILRRAEKIFLEDLPIAPLYHWNFCYLHKPHVKNIQQSPVGGVFFERLSMEKQPCTESLEACDHADLIE